MEVLKGKEGREVERMLDFAVENPRPGSGQLFLFGTPIVHEDDTGAKQCQHS